MKQKLSALLALLTLTGAITSCSSTSDVTSDTTASGNDTVAETAADDGDMPNYLTLEENFGGKQFRILGMDCAAYPQFTNFEIDVEEENGDVVNDAIYRRNSAIEETYNVDIVQKLSELDHVETNTAYYKYIQTSVLAGENEYDMFFISLRDAGNVIQNKYAMDMYELPYIDFSEDYWNEDTSNAALSVNGRLYLTNSDFSLLDKRRAYIMIYNRDLFSEFNDEVLEDLVYDGTWTFDKLSEYIRSASTDLNGDGILDENDRWGLTMDSPHGFGAFMVGMGGTLISKDGDDNYTINALSDRMVSIYDKIHTVLVSEKNNCVYAGQHKWVDSKLFTGGKAMFTTSFPQSLQSYSSNSDIDYGVMVWPKYDEAQEKYYSFADKFGSVLFGVPITNTELDLTGFMLEVLSGYSTDTTLKAYYEISCKVKYVYDETSAEMLDLALSNIVYDIGAIFDWNGIYSDIIHKTGSKTANTYVSEVERIKDSVQNKIDDMIDDLL